MAREIMTYVVWRKGRDTDMSSHLENLRNFGMVRAGIVQVGRKPKVMIKVTVQILTYSKEAELKEYCQQNNLLFQKKTDTKPKR